MAETIIPVRLRIRVDKELSEDEVNKIMENVDYDFIDRSGLELILQSGDLDWDTEDVKIIK